VSVWGRRSLFYLDRKPLLVSELFMPEFNKTIASM
jgi:chorismate-pyruvate lyase